MSQLSPSGGLAVLRNPNLSFYLSARFLGTLADGPSVQNHANDTTDATATETTLILSVQYPSLGAEALMLMEHEAPNTIFA